MSQQSMTIEQRAEAKRTELNEARREAMRLREVVPTMQAEVQEKRRAADQARSTYADFVLAKRLGEKVKKTPAEPLQFEVEARAAEQGLERLHERIADQDALIAHLRDEYGALRGDLAVHALRIVEREHQQALDDYLPTLHRYIVAAREAYGRGTVPLPDLEQALEMYERKLQREQVAAAEGEAQ